ncbi:hypothetical protein T484DRAFT_1650074, partial [Baffinella frigidus]
NLTPATQSLQAILALLEAGANGKLTNKHGNTPLHLTQLTNHSNSWYKTAPAVLALLEGGANTKLTNKDGDTPLHLAAQMGNEGVVRAPPLHQPSREDQIVDSQTFSLPWQTPRKRGFAQVKPRN